MNLSPDDPRSRRNYRMSRLAFRRISPTRLTWSCRIMMSPCLSVVVKRTGPLSLGGVLFAPLGCIDVVQLRVGFVVPHDREFLEELLHRGDNGGDHFLGISLSCLGSFPGRGEDRWGLLQCTGSPPELKPASGKGWFLFLPAGCHTHTSGGFTVSALVIQPGRAKAGGGGTRFLVHYPNYF